MADDADKADGTRTFEKKEISPNCTRCTIECHGHYPHNDHRTEQHPRWLQTMIAHYH